MNREIYEAVREILESKKEVCHRCEGEGKLWREVCHRCEGEGKLWADGLAHFKSILSRLG